MAAQQRRGRLEPGGSRRARLARSSRSLGFGNELVWLDQAGAPLLAQPVALATDRDDVTVVQQAVQDRGGNQGVPEDACPLAHAAVAGDQDATPLVAPAQGLTRN